MAARMSVTTSAPMNTTLPLVQEPTLLRKSNNQRKYVGGRMPETKQKKVWRNKRVILLPHFREDQNISEIYQHVLEMMHSTLECENGVFPLTVFLCELIRQLVHQNRFDDCLSVLSYYKSSSSPQDKKQNSASLLCRQLLVSMQSNPNLTTRLPRCISFKSNASVPRNQSIPKR